MPFDIAADPTVVLGPYYKQAAFPMQMIIRASDMQITFQENGLQPPGRLDAEFDKILNGQ